MRATAIKTELKILGIVALVGLGFAIYTQHAWEDYWITFRASRNLATGHGLVFTPGERLQTFTSPLGVLLPAGISWLTGNQSDGLALWLFRLVSIAALAAGIALLFHALRTVALRRVSCWLTAALIGFDAKILDFSINGMETGLLIFFLALAIHGLLVSGPRQWLRIGAGWAGLMWTRPDSCVYIAILGLGALLFLSSRTAGITRRKWGTLLFRAGAVCAVVYLPWFLWAWWYYGSPIPHTIVAKAANHPALSPAGLIAAWLMFPFDVFTSSNSSLQYVFLPAYADIGGWPGFLWAVSDAIGLCLAFAWLLPVLRPQIRLFSLAFFLGNCFLTTVIRYSSPWYYPPVEVFGYLTIGLLFDQALCLASRLSSLGRGRGWLRSLGTGLGAAAVGLLLGQVVLTFCVARQLQVQQKLIENGLRREIGLWLRQHARSPQDSVMLESLGYIGYFSGLKMLDYPGLASTEMVETRKRLGPNREQQALRELRPTWVVLRPREQFDGLFSYRQDLLEFYDQVKTFDAADQVRAIRWLPGRPYLEFDQTFLVFHRKADAAAHASP